MPRESKSLRRIAEHPELSGLHLRRQDLHNATRADRLVASARRQSRALLETADQQAAETHAAAFSEGYRDGLCGAIDTVFQHLIACDDVYAALEAEVFEQARERVEHLLGNSDALMLLSREILESVRPRKPASVNVYLPKFARGDARRFQRVFADYARHVTVKEAPDPNRFVVEWGQEVWDFDIGLVTREIAADALVRLRANPTAWRSCQKNSIESLQTLRDALSERIEQLKQETT